MDVIAATAAAVLPTLCFHPAAQAWVFRWAGRFRLEERIEPPAPAGEPVLWAAPDHLELLLGGTRDKGAWITEAEVRRRARQGPELLRACGIRPGMRVLDAMAGWGLDGLVLAMGGASVIMVDREPHMQALQEDLIRRMCCGAVESRLGDGFLALDDADGFDVVYLDPMFPERGKQALPGKRMQYLARLAAPADGERPLAEWIARAVAIARHRVVVKRRLHDPAASAPDWQIRGRSIRYDVYRGRAVSAPAAPRSESPDR